MLSIGYYSLSPLAELVGDALEDVSLTPTDASVGYQLTSGGLERSYEGIAGSYSTLGTWLLYGSASDYECQLTVTGTSPTGTVGSWVSLGSTQSWTLTDSGVAGPVISNSCTIEIRNATTLIVVATATVTMSVHEEA